MEKIKIRHFNGLETDWKVRIDSGEYNGDIVFAKTWKQNPSTLQWERNLVIYAGKDQYDQEYQFDIADHDTFLELEKRVNILEGRFTDSSFREALENYIKDSSRINEINSSINKVKAMVDSSINDFKETVNEKFLEIDSSIDNINASIGNIGLAIIDINNDIAEMNMDIDNIHGDIDTINSSIGILADSAEWLERY